MTHTTGNSKVKTVSMPPELAELADKRRKELKHVTFSAYLQHLLWKDVGGLADSTAEYGSTKQLQHLAPEKPSSKKVKCQNCSALNDADSRYCKKCGKPMKLHCQKCHVVNDEDAKFCKQCGTAL